MNCRLLLNVPLEVVTVTNPVVAPLGTVAPIKVPEYIFTEEAGTPLNETVLVDVNPCPRIWTGFPTFPE
jgi:hypothetical protein